jgi:hypothetical protein
MRLGHLTLLAFVDFTPQKIIELQREDETLISVILYLEDGTLPKLQKKIFELTNCENKFLRELPLFNFESGFKNIPNNVDLYNDVRNLSVSAQWSQSTRKDDAWKYV